MAGHAQGHRPDRSCGPGLFHVDPEYSPDVFGRGFFKAEKAKTEERLRVLAGRQTASFEQKARDLARYMVTGEIEAGNHAFHRNAYAIARLADPKAPEADVEALRSVLDRLVTIYAIELLDPREKAVLETLAKDEPEGFSFMVFYAASLQETESKKIEGYGETARLNAHKGYVPMETREGLRLVLVAGPISVVAALTGPVS